MAQFKELFSVRVTHSFYRAGCPDLIFAIPPGSSTALAGGRLLARMVEGRLRVLYEADDNGEATVSMAGKTLRFGLRLVNPNFGNFTELAIAPASVAVYRNSGNKAKLDAPEVAAPATGVVAHSLARVARPVTVSVVSNGITAHEQIVTAAETRQSVTVDFTGLQAGSYVVEESYPTGPIRRSAYYFDPHLFGEGLFGAVEVGVDASFYAAPPAFEIGFEAREDTLRYYLVAQGYPAAEFDKLKVTDIGFSAASRPEVKFDRVAEADFGPAELPKEVLGAAGARVAAFRSKAPVVRTEGGRQRIQLSSNGDVLIPNLPQPGATQPTADLIVHLSK